MSRNFRLLLVTRCLRAFGFGFAAVLLGLHLERRGLSAGQIGLALTVALASASLLSLAFAAAAARLGRRAMLAAAGVLMAAAGADLALATPAWLLVLGGLTGMLAVQVDVGPFASVEQAVLAESVTPARRNRAFARYSLTGGLAVAAGGLASSAGSDLARGQALFLLYAGLGLATGLLPLLLSAAVEAGRSGPPFGSLRKLAGLSGLFMVDALGGGLVANAVIAYWLHVRFGAGSAVLGPEFGAIAVLQSLSYELSGRLADRIGLVRTMVFTHLPSNVLLLLVPLSPTLAWALGLLLARFAISQMDVPARQAYIVSIVPPGERAGALALMGAVRGLSQAAGPGLAGLAIQAALFGIPFYLGGGLKIVYDLGLYAGFHKRPAEHENTRQ